MEDFRSEATARSKPARSPRLGSSPCRRREALGAGQSEAGPELAHRSSPRPASKEVGVRAGQQKTPPGGPARQAWRAGTAQQQRSSQSAPASGSHSG